MTPAASVVTAVGGLNDPPSQTVGFLLSGHGRPLPSQGGQRPIADRLGGVSEAEPDLNSSDPPCRWRQAGRQRRAETSTGTTFGEWNRAMPFDGLHDEQKGYLLEQLDAVADLLSSEDRWCKHHLRHPSGARCLLGALTDAHARLILYQPIKRAAHDVTGIPYSRVESFNDAPGTDFETIRAVLDRVRKDIVAGAVPHGRLDRVRYFLARRLDSRRRRAQAARPREVPSEQAPTAMRTGIRPDWSREIAPRSPLWSVLAELGKSAEQPVDGRAQSSSADRLRGPHCAEVIATCTKVTAEAEPDLG